MNLAFFSGNEVFWKIRYENSMDDSKTPHRTIGIFKETHSRIGANGELVHKESQVPPSRSQLLLPTSVKSVITPQMA